MLVRPRTSSVEVGKLVVEQPRALLDESDAEVFGRVEHCTVIL